VVPNNSVLLSKLQGSVRVPSTREVINNPFAADGVTSLCGMMLILFHEFVKPQLSLFTKHMLLLDAVKFDKKRCSNDIEGVLQEYSEIVTFWLTSDLYRLMTIDNFFTSHFLIALDPDSNLRSECLKEVNTYTRKLESKSLSPDKDLSDDEEYEHLTFKNMPMLSHLFTTLREGVVKTKELEEVSVRATPAPSAPVERQQNKDFRPKNHFGKQYLKPALERGHEMAMNATVTKSTTVRPFQHHKSQSYPTELPKNHQLITEDLFPRKIAQNENYRCLIPGTNTYGGYSATDQPCPQCSDPDPQKHHPVRCFMKACHKCSFYGHTGSTCRQKFVKQTTDNEQKTLVKHD
jgi:hypothetical protein